MSDWYWRVIALKATFALTFIFCNVRAEDTVQKLPYCNPTIEKDDTNLNDLVIVSTLDGRLTAFSTENGIKAWDLETQPLLSSNLHHVELIVDEEKEQQGGTVGPCMEAIVQRSICLLDALCALAAAERPPGARALALTTGTALLRRTRQPCVNSAHVYRPLQRMLIQCNENPASPTEKEEVELLLTLCGLVRKEPGLANIFTTPFVEDKSTLLSIPEDIQKLIPIRSKVQTPKKNPLFEVELPPNPLRNVSIIRTGKDDCNATSSSSADDNASCKSQKTVYDDNDKFLLIDLLLSYLNSADNQVVLRACEGIMIVSSLPEDDIANLVTSCSPAYETIVHKLAAKYRAIPANVDPSDVDHLNITWALVIVSTLDGRLTAFSTENGIKAWDLETQPLLSSNLHHVEVL